MSNKAAGTKSDSKVADMAESQQSNPHLFLDQLEVDVTGTIIVMIGRVWDVNVITGRYLSTYFVVFDSKDNMIHYTTKGNIAHNFLRLKEGGIYSIKNFVVLHNKYEFRIFKRDTFMLEFDGETKIRKVSANDLGFLRYRFRLVVFDRIELTNKYLNDLTGYVTNVGRTTYQKSGSKTLDFYLANQRASHLGSSYVVGLVMF